MQRRDFIRLVGAATAWPLAARAQPRSKHTIGAVRVPKRGESAHLEEAFRKGLAQTGYVENQNVVIEWRYAEGDYQRLTGIVTELVDRRVDVIVALGATTTALAAKAATQTIPIVFMLGSDPIKFGLVASFGRPGGNITGVSILQGPVVTKRLDLLHQLIPTATTFAVLIEPDNAFSETERSEAEAAARTLGLELHVANPKRQDEIDAQFPDLIARGVRGIMIGTDAIYLGLSRQIAASAARYAVPTVAQWREYPAAGGLMSYGSSVSEGYRLAATYVGRILNGEKPADMPVQQPTKFEFVINLATAKALRLTIADKMLAIADEVIE
ncbi:ABC transporter substrate-binding protein [Bradyrhizobium sp. CIAT3101]|uniref:ABC transporter substrate-binding protein n=1 Tax=Bradyrhizobium sp. CIAT3101 TaxID=439387 RepID=UPI0024B03AF3|nr:ABC transporter substrate-binding protein [Bradyrhizobium sp. CIAT3101]WFU82950.1 ABC transporter substrate-binding protein [Bradyrhizobium sp. CIAT3101]